MSTKKATASPEDFSGIAVLGERGQIVVPIQARKRLKLKQGDSFVVMAHHGAVVLYPKKKIESFIKHLTTKLKI